MTIPKNNSFLVSRKLKVFRKSQTATEYLIILAVVIVIALIVVGVLGGIPGIGGGASKKSTLAALQNEKVGIIDYVFYNFTGKIKLRNNLADTIRIENILYKNYGESWNTRKCFIMPFNLRQGETKTVTCLYILNSTSYSFNLSINYTDISTGANYIQTGGDMKISGKVEGTQNFQCSSCKGDANFNGRIDMEDMNWTIFRIEDLNGGSDINCTTDQYDCNCLDVSEDGKVDIFNDVLSMVPYEGQCMP